MFELTGAAVTKRSVEFVGGAVLLQAESLLDKRTWFRAFRTLCTVDAIDDPSTKDGEEFSPAQEKDDIDPNAVLQLWTWGATDHGQLGTGERSTTGRAIPQLNASLKNKFAIRQVSVGYHHAGCVAADGSVFTWGSNE